MITTLGQLNSQVKGLFWVSEVKGNMGEEAQADDRNGRLGRVCLWDKVAQAKEAYFKTISNFTSLRMEAE